MVLMGLLLLAGATTTSVEYDHQVNFAQYKTWSWHEGSTPAMNPAINAKIHDGIEKGLASRGLTRADSGGSLFAVYHAVRTTEIELLPLNSASPAPPSGIRYAQKGSLVIELSDATSGKVVWRGHAAGVLKYGPKEGAAQVDAAVAELLAGYPPPAR